MPWLAPGHRAMQTCTAGDISTHPEQERGLGARVQELEKAWKAESRALEMRERGGPWLRPQIPRKTAEPHTQAGGHLQT